MKTKNKIKSLNVVSSELKKAILANEEIKINSLLIELDKSIDEERKEKKGKNLLISILIIATLVISYLSFESTNIAGDSLRVANKQDSLTKVLTDYLLEYRSTVDTVLNLASRNDSMHNILHESKLKVHEKELSLYQRKLFIIDSIYGIKFIDKDGYQVLEASKVDSALMLFPYYRNKLRYSKSTNKWKIEIPR